MILADFAVGQVLWSIFWFFIFFLWIWLVITIFADLIRDHELSGWWKALWAVFIIFLPFLGVFIYLIVRGGSMAERSAQDARKQEEAFQQYVRQTVATTPEGAPGAGAADELAKLADLHAKGTLSDEEYAKAKARVLG